MTERLVHEASDAVLADSLTWARGPLERARGLIGRPVLEAGQALVLERAAQVHTFFIRSPIDVLFCTARWEVLSVVSPMARRRVSRWVRRTRYIVELPPGTASEVRTGDRLRLLP